MSEYPMTFDEFIKQFATEEQCRDYLYRLRWPDGFVCPKCSKSAKAWRKARNVYECSLCGHQASVIAGTVFQDTRKSLRAWFIAIWWVTTQKNGASATGLQQVLGLGSYQTAWTWLHKIRTAMVNPNRAKLSGDVEVDETYIGGEESGGKRGRGTENKVLVAIAVELATKTKGKKGRRAMGRARIQVIPDASKKSLHGFIKDNISSKSTVITDGWSGYSSLEENECTHIISKKHEVDADENLMPHVHLLVSLLKRWLLGTHQGAVQEKHIQAYLDEYVFRFNRRNSAKRGLLFYRLLETTMQVPPTTYKELVYQEF
jgi:transposase-like protein/Zn ribbon nucleic-acid-binding protein